MKNSIKNLFLPGTNKNVGFLDSSHEMYLYERYFKYFPFDRASQPSQLELIGGRWASMLGPTIFLQKDKKAEKYVQLDEYGGYFYNIDTKMYTFFNCKFKTPDNLDVIEMTYLYKNWKQKKKNE